MENVVNISYEATGKSTQVDALGMREIQARAYAARKSQYLLIKAPPASGKSRALMFIALDKLKEGDVKKDIVAVPERAIGKSFASTKLTANGFHSDWTVLDKNNLCVPGADTSNSKVNAFISFLESDEDTILLCTHATLRFAFDRARADKFKNCLVAARRVPSRFSGLREQVRRTGASFDGTAEYPYLGDDRVILPWGRNPRVDRRGRGKVL